MLAKIGRDVPFVAKVGNFHGGYGKLLVDDAARWSEYADLIETADTYVATEPFIEHRRDVRCLQVGARHWAIERTGRHWRANVDTIKVRPIEPPEPLVEWTSRVAEHRGLDVLGLDALETDAGWAVLEVNDVPGLRGFPDEVLDVVAERVLALL
jgi:ribosomal protein S6--L-glutamate ligase